MTADQASGEAAPTATVTRRELVMARALEQTRSRAENRVELFLDAARALMNDSSEFTVQEVVERSGQSLRTFYQYFAGKHELLLALFEESIRAAASHLEQVVAESDEPLDRLHRFAVEYHRMCRLTPEGRPASGPTPAMVEFAQQLLTSHPNEAALAFSPLMAQLEQLLADASANGDVRPDLDHRRIAGVVLQATMFNAFASAISGSSSHPDMAEPETLWELLVRGIGVGA
jgi:AcrR family transcriptional regulator